MWRIFPPKVYSYLAFHQPRRWSNRQLAQHGHLFPGDIANISGWQDSDKQGRTYKSYFSSAKSYCLTNFDSAKRGFQGYENEIFLDLEAELPQGLNERFDVVFNHTVLEHIYDFQRAINNICDMSRDIVILVVPWMQPVHAYYGDYWRISPLALRRLMKERGLTLLYLKWSNMPLCASYIYMIASKHPDRWESYFDPTEVENRLDKLFENKL